MKIKIKTTVATYQHRLHYFLFFPFFGGEGDFFYRYLWRKPWVGPKEEIAQGTIALHNTIVAHPMDISLLIHLLKNSIRSQPPLSRFFHSQEKKKQTEIVSSGLFRFYYFEVKLSKVRSYACTDKGF